jgi:hypothetical protein
MPVFTFHNTTPDLIFMRVYDPAQYTIRSRVFDPYYATFWLAPNVMTQRTDHRYEMVFKAIDTAHQNMGSGNIAVSRRNAHSDAQWRAANISISVDIDGARNAVRMA